MRTFLPAFLKARRNGKSLKPSCRSTASTWLTTDTTPGQRVYDPKHPDADTQGFVIYPNVNLVTEMTNMLSATRSHEAAMSVIEAAKRMALRVLDISLRYCRSRSLLGAALLRNTLSGDAPRTTDPYGSPLHYPLSISPASEKAARPANAVAKVRQGCATCSTTCSARTSPSFR